jgi:transcriptional regulator with XRE-family HTH domain
LDYDCNIKAAREVRGMKDQGKLTATARRLRALREGLGLALREVARQAGLNPAILFDLENQGGRAGQRRPLGRYAERLAVALGDAVIQLAGGQEALPLVLDLNRAKRLKGLDTRAREFFAFAAQRPIEVPDDAPVEVWRTGDGALVVRALVT